METHLYLCVCSLHVIKKLLKLLHTVTDCLRWEGTSGDHLVQPHVQSIVS